MANRKRNSNVIDRRHRKSHRRRRSLGLNVGMIVFLVFFIYLAVNVISYMTRGETRIYEVGTASSVVQDNTYTGLILRSETVHNAPEAGYINYYIREGNRSAVGSTVYSVDTNGAYTEFLNSGISGDSSLTSEQLSTLKTKLSAFASTYRSNNFRSVYDLKYNLQNLLFSYIASSSLEDLEEVGIDTSYLLTVEADVSGVVEYYADGYETMTEDKLTADDLNDSKYEKNSVTAGTLVEAEAPVYKTITSEDWVVYLPLSEEDRVQLADQTRVTLYFTDVNLEVTADFSLISLSDGTMVGRCCLSRYMVQLADRRYTNVTVKKSDISSLNITGLKIPKSSVTTKSFCVVPVDYAVYGEDGELGFSKETYTADGTVVEFITPTIYASNENYYYLDPTEIEDGTVLRRPSSLEAYQAVRENSQTETSAEDEEDEDSEDREEDSEDREEEDSEDWEDEDSEDWEEEDSEDWEDEDSEDREDEDSEDGEDEDDRKEENAGEEGESYEEAGGTSTFTVGTTAELTGVYNVNRGYAVFRQISILDESDDYYIVEEGQSYGLSMYDHILLDGASYEEGDLIYG